LTTARARAAFLAMSTSKAAATSEEAVVVVELPPEARVAADDELRFTGLDTTRPTLRLPSGVVLEGRYEMSVGHLLVVKPDGAEGAELLYKSETRLIFAPSDKRPGRRDATR
jgi:hypothetical protein